MFPPSVLVSSGLKSLDRVLTHGIGRNATSSTGIVVVVGISVVVAIAERGGTGNTLLFKSNLFHLFFLVLLLLKLHPRSCYLIFSSLLEVLFQN